MTHASLRHLDSVASLQELRLVDLLKQYRSEVELVQSRTNMRKQIALYEENGNSDSLSIVRKISNDAISAVPHLIGMTFYNPALDVILAAEESSDFSDEKISEYQLSETQLTLLGFFPYLERSALIAFVAPLYHNDIFIGFVRVELSAEPLLLLSETYDGLGKTGETGIALKMNEDQFISLTRLRHKENDLLGVGDIHEKDGKSPIRKALMGLEEIFIDDITDYRSKEVFAATRSADVLDEEWALTVKIDKSEALADYLRFRFMLLFTLFGGMTAIALITGIFMLVTQGMKKR